MRFAQPSMTSAKAFLPLVLAFFVCLPAASAAEDAFKAKASLVTGYDNNSGLNQSKKGDIFAQESLFLNYTLPAAKWTKLKISGGALNSNYFEATDQNIFLPSLGLDADFRLAEATTLETSYDFQYVDFVNNEGVTLFKNEWRAGLRQKIDKRWTLRGGLSFSVRDYEDRKKRDGGGHLIDEERQDTRPGLDTELRFKPDKKTLLKAGYLYYVNDSNDLFNDYYDYSAHQVFFSVSKKLLPRLSLFYKFSIEDRAYDERPVAGVPGLVQDDENLANLLGLTYQWRSDLALTANFSYREKLSNANALEYSGVITSLGLRYSF